METNIIYNADMRDILKDMPEESIDLIVSDVPYKIVKGGTRIIAGKDECGGILNKRYIRTKIGILDTGRSKLIKNWLKSSNPQQIIDMRAGKVFTHNDLEFSEWLPYLYKVLKKGTHCYLMVNSRNLKELQQEAEKVGLVFQNLLVWAKNNKTPNRYYMQQMEFILMLSKRPARPINYMGSSNLYFTANVKNKDHPTQKPVALMSYLIRNSTVPNEIVLDPFCGTGSTLLAAKNLNREYIGIEIDKKYYQKAKEKLEDTDNLFKEKK